MKALWTCEELALPFERVDVGGAFAFRNAPDHVRSNPNGRVPTVGDDGFVLWESNVILRALADVHGAGRLVPLGRARWNGEQWMELAADDVAPADAHRVLAARAHARRAAGHGGGARRACDAADAPGCQRHLTLPPT